MSTESEQVHVDVVNHIPIVASTPSSPRSTHDDDSPTLPAVVIPEEALPPTLSTTEVSMARVSPPPTPGTASSSSMEAGMPSSGLPKVIATPPSPPAPPPHPSPTRIIPVPPPAHKIRYESLHEVLSQSEASPLAVLSSVLPPNAAVLPHGYVSVRNSGVSGGSGNIQRSKTARTHRGEEARIQRRRSASESLVLPRSNRARRPSEGIEGDQVRMMSIGNGVVLDLAPEKSTKTRPFSTSFQDSGGAVLASFDAGLAEKGSLDHASVMNEGESEGRMSENARASQEMPMQGRKPSPRVARKSVDSSSMVRPSSALPAVPVAVDRRKLHRSLVATAHLGHSLSDAELEDLEKKEIRLLGRLHALQRSPPSSTPPDSPEAAMIGMEDRVRYYRDRARLVERIAYTRERLLRYQISVLRAAILTSHANDDATAAIMAQHDRSASSPPASPSIPTAYDTTLSNTSIPSTSHHDDDDSKLSIDTRHTDVFLSPASPPTSQSRSDAIMASMMERIRPRSMDLGTRPISVIHNRGGSGGSGGGGQSQAPWWKGVFRRGSDKPS